jgi:hypothetical protein
VCHSCANQTGLFSSSNDLGICLPACYGIASSITRMHGLLHDSESCQRLGTPRPSDPGSSIQTPSPWVAPRLVRPACTSPSMVCSNISKASHLLRSNTSAYLMDSCFHIFQSMTAQVPEARRWLLASKRAGPQPPTHVLVNAPAPFKSWPTDLNRHPLAS